MARQPERTRQEPRISANDLALYMVSSDTARMGIIRRSKYPQRPPIIRYREARRAVSAYLSDPVRSIDHLTNAEERFQAVIDDPSSRALVRDDATHSIDVLHAIQAMSNQLGGYDFQMPPRNQDKLSIGGTEVSVRADLLVLGTSRGMDQIGSAILRMTRDDADTPLAIERRRNMGLYVATLARLHTDQNIQSVRKPVNRLCMSIDVQHGEIFLAPNASTRRVNDLVNACRMIAAIWPSIEN